MSEKLSSEKEKLILENQRLVYYLVQKLGIEPSSSQYEDIASIGTIGLIKAAKTFDSSKKIAFATYASRCINNEIFMYYRKAGKYASEISLDEPMGTNKGDKDILLGDMVEDEKSSDYIEEMEIRESFCQVASIILNCLKGIEKSVMFYKIADMNQPIIAKTLGISQSYVSRIYNRSINKIKSFINNDIKYKEVFYMSISEEEYRISFSSKNIRNFNKIFATFLSESCGDFEKVPNFKVDCNKDRVLIQLPAHPNSFIFIAKIIQEIDEFTVSYVGNGIKAYKNSDIVIKEENDSVAKVETESAVEEKATKPLGKGNKSKQIRDYMLSLSSFSTKELKLHFPTMNTTTIASVIFEAKKKGLIVAEGKGKYRVIGRIIEKEEIQE